MEVDSRHSFAAWLRRILLAVGGASGRMTSPNQYVGHIRGISFIAFDICVTENGRRERITIVIIIRNNKMLGFFFIAVDAVFTVSVFRQNTRIFLIVLLSFFSCLVGQPNFCEERLGWHAKCPWSEVRSVFSHVGMHVITIDHIQWLSKQVGQRLHDEMPMCR